MSLSTKLILTLIGLSGLAGLLFYFFSRFTGDTLNSTSGDQNKERVEHTKANPIDNPYEGLRNQALSATPEQLDQDSPKNKTRVFGVVMDWNLGEGIATLVAFESGDASSYLSTGGGTIGGAFHKNVNRAAKEFVKASQAHLDHSIRTEKTPLPPVDTIRFFFLTNNGKYVVDEEMKNLESGSSRLAPLFDDANKLITALRLVSEERAK